MTFSEFFKVRRKEYGTVRQFAKKNGFDAAYISRLENGISLPPKDQEKLFKSALLLALKKVQMNGRNSWISLRLQSANYQRICMTMRELLRYYLLSIGHLEKKS